MMVDGGWKVTEDFEANAGVAGTTGAEKVIETT